MRIVVVGAGAIGGFVGGKLAASGHAVTFVDRPFFADAVRENGLRIIEPDNTTTIHPTVVTQLAEAFKSSSPADLVLICVKTFDMQAAVDELRPYGSRFRHILTLQNGLSNEDILSQAFGAGKVIAGTITHPVVVPEPGVVRSEKKKGGIGVALVNGQSADSWADTLNKTGIVTRAYADYRAMKWSKLLLNIIGNATSAVLNMNTVRVFADRRLLWLETEQLREAIRVMSVVQALVDGLLDHLGNPALILLQKMAADFLQPVYRRDAGDELLNLGHDRGHDVGDRADDQRNAAHIHDQDRQRTRRMPGERVDNRQGNISQHQAHSERR